MDTFRIRRAGTERTVGDAAALVALARSGELRGADEVWTGTAWVSAAKLPSLQGVFAPGDDPWAAWSDVDTVDARSLYRRMVDQPEDLPSDALTPVGEALPSDALTELEPLPDDPSTDERPRPSLAATVPGNRRSENDKVRSRDVATLPVRPASNRPPPLDGGELIDFPRVRPVPELMPTPARAPKKVPLVRASRLAAMVSVGMLLLMLGYAWMQVANFSRPTASTPKKVTTSANPSPLIAMEQELRSALSPTPRAIERPGDLSNALTVELIQHRIDLRSADGTVTKWIGRKGDEPRVAEVRVRFKSSGEISRELGAIALVVGRYKRLYRLEISVFEVTEEGTGGVTKIDPDQAESFYQARINLQTFLQSLT